MSSSVWDNMSAEEKELRKQRYMAEMRRSLQLFEKRSAAADERIRNMTEEEKAEFLGKVVSSQLADERGEYTDDDLKLAVAFVSGKMDTNPDCIKNMRTWSRDVLKSRNMWTDELETQYQQLPHD